MSNPYKSILTLALVIWSGLLAFLTLLPLVPSDAGFVRIWDFPRPQLAVLSICTIAVLVLSRVWRKRWGLPLLAILCLAFGYQFKQILPYTPVASLQVAVAEEATGDSCVSVLSANVYQSNRKAAALMDLIAAHDPDILLLMETDPWWREALQPVVARYPHHKAAILSNTYGLMFLTRLEGESAINYLIEDDIPSVQASLQLPSGEAFTFYGLHPEPPLINQSSEERDAELLLVARKLRDAGEPAMVAGDLNDVAWSATTQQFIEISRTLDPRVGRGLYASFHADHALLRWPLDHLFHTDDFLVSHLEILPHVGSDHFPVFGRFCFRGIS